MTSVGGAGSGPRGMRSRRTARTCQQPQRPISSGVTATRAKRRRSSRWWPFSQGASFSGGKKRLRRQPALGLFQHARLVAFESEEIIRAQLQGDKVSALLLTVNRVGGDEAAFQRRQRTEQGFEGGDFIALLLDGDLAQRQAEAVAHGREQLQRLALVARAAAHDFAVHG